MAGYDQTGGFNGTLVKNIFLKIILGKTVA